MLMIAAAAMARDGDDRLRTIMLFATETDFTEPGELGVFLDESQVSDLESLMREQGGRGSPARGVLVAAWETWLAQRARATPGHGRSHRGVPAAR